MNFFTVLSHPVPAEDPTPPATAGPALSIVQSGNTVTISWPASATGFTLESKNALSDLTWTPVPGVVNNSKTIDIVPGAIQFFRLRQ